MTDSLRNGDKIESLSQHMPCEKMNAFIAI